MNRPTELGSNLVGFDSFHSSKWDRFPCQGKKTDRALSDYRREETFLANCETPFGLLNDPNFFLKGKEWARLLMVMKKTV